MVGRGGFANDAQDLGVLLQAFVAAGACVLAQNAALVEQLDTVVVVGLGVAGGEAADFTHGDVAVGDGIGGEVEGIGGSLVLEDEDVGRVGVGTGESRGRKAIAVVVMLRRRIDVVGSEVVVVCFRDCWGRLAGIGGERGVTTAGRPESAPGRHGGEEQ